MKNTDTDYLKKRQRRIWLASFLTACLIVLGMNTLSNPATVRRSNVEAAGIGDPTMQSSCSKNRQDICVTGRQVDLYPAGKELATNPQLRNREDDAWKDIGGVVTDINEDKLSLKTSTGRTFHVTYPVPIESWWNQNISRNYDNYQFGVGDTIVIHYLEPADETRKEIRADQIFASSLAIDPSIPASEPIRRYPSEKYGF